MRFLRFTTLVLTNLKDLALFGIQPWVSKKGRERFFIGSFMKITGSLTFFSPNAAHCPLFHLNIYRHVLGTCETCPILTGKI